MALSRMQICRRWDHVLRLKIASIALQYSTQLLVARTTKRIPYTSSPIPGNRPPAHVGQRWKQSVCFYSDSVPKHATNYTKEKDRGDLSGTGAALQDRSPHSNEVGYVSPVTTKQAIIDLDDVPKISALDEIPTEEAVSLTVPSALPPASFSLRDYVDESETLTKLVQLGVNLWKLEQRPYVANMLLKLDFETEVAPRLLFLKDIGVEDTRLGYILSHNPFFLTERLENLQDRVKYLRSMKFTAATVVSMVSRAPYLLNFSVPRLDNRLGFYQKELGLSPAKTRDIVARLPRLLCGSLEPVKETLMVCKVELGFKDNEVRHIVTVVPKVLMTNKRKLIQTFDLIHNTMEVPHHLIVKFPQVLNSSYMRVKERHLFLQYLGKAQYDPTQPNYVPLDRLAILPDDAFCTELASATLEDFELFLKTV